MISPFFRPAGSSPLARGLRGQDRLRRASGGIIPARAGFTLRGVTTNPRLGDHPRSRGVYKPATVKRDGAVGSSPLARGLRLHPRKGCISFRIIPARAGFTAASGRGPSSWPDHPRSRGVYASSLRNPGLRTGSSPLARGLLTHFDQGTSDHGIIPARAGFTITSRRRTPGLWDHPRSRGVYCSPQCRGAASAGSSPLARGLRDRPHEAGEGGRIIPARAGFTPR